MPTLRHEYDWPDRFVLGAVGEPGARTFYLQVRHQSEVLSVSLEKQQAAAIAAGMDQILDELRSQDGNPASVPESPMPELVDEEPLDEPIVERFRVGPLALGWDPSSRQIAIEAAAFPGDEEEELDDEPEELLVVRVPVGAARAFAKRARDVVASGRPPCPLCGGPVDPGGHVCPGPGLG